MRVGAGNCLRRAARCRESALSAFAALCFAALSDSVLALACNRSAEFGPFGLMWNLTSTTLELAVAYRTDGAADQWIAAGFSPDGDMEGSYAVIGFAAVDSRTAPIRSDVQQVVGSWLLSEMSQSGVNSDAGAMGATGMRVTNDGVWTTIAFHRPLVAAPADAGDDTPVPNVSTTDNTIMVFATGVWDFSAAKPGQHRPTDRFHGAINFATGDVSVWTESDAWKTAHATLMAVSFGVLFPFGVVSARFGRWLCPNEWFIVHRAFQLTGIGAVTIALLLALVNGSGTAYTHQVLGLVVASMMYVQAITAWVRPHPQSQCHPLTPQRKFWNFAHHWLGRGLFILAVAQAFVGFSILSPSRGYVAAFVVGLTLVIALYAALEFVRYRNTGKLPMAAANGATSSVNDFGSGTDTIATAAHATNANTFGDGHATADDISSSSVDFVAIKDPSKTEPNALPNCATAH